MAIKTGIYLSDPLEKEVTLRLGPAPAGEDKRSVSFLITRFSTALFDGLTICRSKISEIIRYDEMRFLCYVVAKSDLILEDDIRYCDTLTHCVQVHWIDLNTEDAVVLSDLDTSLLFEDRSYWTKVDPDALCETISHMHIFDVMALIDGIQIVIASDKRDRELARLFPGVKRPA